MDRIVAVFVFNRLYMEHFYRCCRELIENGRFTGDIIGIIGDDLTEEEVDKASLGSQVKIIRFPEMEFPPHVKEVIRSLKTGDDRHLTKTFQWHKINVLQPFFRQWDYVFYLDANLHITADISPILEQRKKNTIRAHDDDYPFFIRVLADQFDKMHPLFQSLSTKYDMTCRYFQTTCMLFDTALITDAALPEIENLILRYPCCGTNEQGFFSLYFASIKKCWEPFIIGDEKTFYYNNFRRDRSKPYLIYKG